MHLVTATDAEAISTARQLALLLGQQGTMPGTADAEHADGALGDIDPGALPRVAGVHTCNH